MGIDPTVSRPEIGMLAQFYIYTHPGVWGQRLFSKVSYSCPFLLIIALASTFMSTYHGLNAFLA